MIATSGFVALKFWEFSDGRVLVLKKAIYLSTRTYDILGYAGDSQPASLSHSFAGIYALYDRDACREGTDVLTTSAYRVFIQLDKKIFLDLEFVL